MKTKAHPLFPARDDASDPPEVHSINVMRGGEGYARRSFTPEELQSLDQLFELYGGGHYTLVAHDDRKITSRMQYPLPGPSKPLNEGAAVGAPPPAPEAAPSPHPGMMPGFGMPEMFMAMMQMNQKAQEQTTQLLTVMMQRDADSARRHIESMQALHDRHAGDQSALVRALFERDGKQAGADNSAEWYMRGQKEVLGSINKFRETLGDDDEETGGGDVIDELVGALPSIIAGMQQAGQGAAAPTVPEPAAAAPPAPPPNHGQTQPGNGQAQPSAFGLRPQGQPIHEPDEDELEV